MTTRSESLAEATSAVRGKTQDVRQSIEQVIADADRMVGTLESDEAEAAEHKL